MPTARVWAGVLARDTRGHAPALCELGRGLPRAARDTRGHAPLQGATCHTRTTQPWEGVSLVELRGTRGQHSPENNGKGAWLTGPGTKQGLRASRGQRSPQTPKEGAWHTGPGTNQGLRASQGQRPWEPQKRGGATRTAPKGQGPHRGSAARGQPTRDPHRTRGAQPGPAVSVSERLRAPAGGSEQGSACVGGCGWCVRFASTGAGARTTGVRRGRDLQLRVSAGGSRDSGRV